MKTHLTCSSMLLAALLLAASPAAADPPARGKADDARGRGKSKTSKTPKATTRPTAAKKTAPARSPAPASQPAADPFRLLRIVVARDKLPPLRSVRVRTKREAEDRSRKGTIKVTIGTRPKGASVFYGGKLLGTTPLSLTAKKGSTPYDVVIRRGGYMILRTRIRRKVNRKYFFTLTPAKIR